MNPPNLKTFSAALAAFALVAGLAHAQTIWNNAGADTQIFNADNWNNGLPSSTNVGAFAGANGNATWTTTQGLTDYHVNVTAGTIASSGFNARTISGGVWNLDGGNFSHVTSNGQVIGLGGGVKFTIKHAASELSSGNGINVSGSGTELVLNAGKVSVTSNLGLVSGGTFEISGGTASVGGNINVSTNFNAGNLVLKGGTLTATDLNYGTNTTGMITAGGSSAGTATFANFAGTEASRRINWLTGSLMSLTITNAADWAQTEWAANRMTFNGQNSAVLGNWATVSSSIFDWNDTTNTLSLAQIPEPGAYALLAGLLGLGVVVLRRRRKVA
jgi:hypothetical protein